jgi:hypothetical protein
VVLIYPVVEVKDFVYGHRYGWLDALLQTAKGFMLRPEREPVPLSLGHDAKTLGRSLGTSAGMHPEGFPAGLTADASTLNRNVTGISLQG